MKRNRNLICVLAFFAFSAGSYAVTNTWDGGGADTNWSTANNWNPNVAPVDGSDLVFPSSPARKTNNNDIVGLDLRSLAINGSGYIIDGNAIALSNGVTANALVAGPNPSFGCDLTLLQAQSFINTGTVRLVSSGALNLNGFNLTVDGSDEITLTSGAISGSGGITMNGSGKLFINASNTYQGVTTISNGTVSLFNSRALGATGAGNDTVVASGASLQVGNGLVVPEAITLSGAGFASGGALDGNITSSCTITGAVTLAANSSVNVNLVGTLNINGPIGGGAFGLTKIGQGTLVLGGSNTYSGATTVSNGILLVNGINAGSPINLTGGTLGGTGKVFQINAAGGTVAPGNSPGILTSSSNVVFDAATTFSVEIGGATPGSQYDRLASQFASLQLGGANLTGSLINGFNPTNGAEFIILLTLSGTRSGQFAQGSSVIIGGRRFSISYGLNFVALTAEPPPAMTGFSFEPGAAGFVLSGTNGVPATAYYVLASTNIFLPTTNWLVVATNVFDGVGNFVFTNAIDPALPQQFLIIQYP